MKIRNGFVSNSSSSSFIIAIDKNKNAPCPHCGRKDIDILELLERDNYNDDNEVIATGYEEIMEQEDGWCFDNDKKNIEEKLQKYRNKKYEIARISISIHDNSMIDIIKNMVENGRIILIDRTLENFYHD